MLKQFQFVILSGAKRFFVPSGLRMTGVILRRSRRISSILSLTLFFIFHSLAFSGKAEAWDKHDQLTRWSLQQVEWLKEEKWQKIKVTSLDTTLQEIFGKNFGIKQFLEKYQINPETKFTYGGKKTGERQSAIDILSAFAPEPDLGMDENMNVSADQKYLGGFTGPTSKGFRHLYFRKWTIRYPFTTFHYPLRALGEAPQRTAIFFDLAHQCFEKNQPYWGMRFLAWALHYVQDLSQPFHSTQIPVLKYVALNSLSQSWDKAVTDTTQIIANYHFLYELYLGYLIDKNSPESQEIAKAVSGTYWIYVTEPALLAKRIASRSQGHANKLGNHCLLFFGKKFLDPSIDVPRNQDKYPPQDFDNEAHLKRFKQMHKMTLNCMKNFGTGTRSLLEMMKERLK